MGENVTDTVREEFLPSVSGTLDFYPAATVRGGQSRAAAARWLRDES